MPAKPVSKVYMTYIYIDESGVLNKNLKQDFFTIKALILNDSNLRQFKKLFKNIKLEEIHFCKLSKAKKQKIIFKISKIPQIKAITIFVKKSEINFNLRSNLGYNYFVKLLLEHSIANIEDNISIKIDNHTTKAGSINSLHDYLKSEMYGSYDFKFDINSKLIDSKYSLGVQGADIISNTMWSYLSYGNDKPYSSLSPELSKVIYFSQSKNTLIETVCNLFWANLR